MHTYIHVIALLTETARKGEPYCNLWIPSHESVSKSWAEVLGNENLMIS